MPANEFEKKVKQRMDELKLAPSGEVWEQVELRIRKEKKRRRIIFWLPFLFLGLGGGLTTFILMNNAKKNPIVKTNELNKPQQLQPVLENNNNTLDTFITTSSISKKRSVAKNNFDKTKSIAENKNRSEDLYKIKIKPSAIKSRRSVKSPSVDLMKSTVKEITDTDLKNNKDDNNEVKVNEPVIEKNAEHSQQKEIPKEDSISSKEQLQKDSTLSDSVITIAEKKVVKSIKQNKKWQWGIGLQKGVSQISNGLKFSGNYVYADYAAATGNPPGGSIQFNKPSAIKTGGSFGAALFVQRTLSTRLKANFDIHYSYLATKINVGTQVDSSFNYGNSYSSSFSLNSFYRSNGNSSSYTNNYHFAGLSAELSWKIISLRKFYIDWNNGISYNRLLSSNALFYDKTLPGYYKNSKLLTHDHLFFSTGMSALVFKNFFINPFAEYSLTSVQKRAVAPKTHFTNYGLRVKLLFNKK